MARLPRLTLAGLPHHILQRGHNLSPIAADPADFDTLRRLLAEQALEFPRADLIDWSSHPVTGVPHRLKHACAELAFKALSQSLYSDLDRGGMVQSERVGPISVTYAAGAPPGKVWQYAQKILEQYIRDPLDFNGPLWTTPDTGYQFTIGMNDTPGDVSTEYE